MSIKCKHQENKWLFDASVLCFQGIHFIEKHPCYFKCGFHNCEIDLNFSTETEINTLPSVDQQLMGNSESFDDT